MYTYTKTIIESDLDFLGHVNNARYMSLLEEARWDHAHHHGMKLTDIKKHQLGFVVLRADLQFKKELTNRENIQIETTFSPQAAKVMTMQQIIRKENGEIACIGDITYGVMDIRTRKLVFPPALWLQMIGASID